MNGEKTSESDEKPKWSENKSKKIKCMKTMRKNRCIKKKDKVNEKDECAKILSLHEKDNEKACINIQRVHKENECKEKN